MQLARALTGRQALTGRCALRVHLYAGTENERSEAFLGYPSSCVAPTGRADALQIRCGYAMSYGPHDNPGPSHWEQPGSEPVLA